MITVISPAKSLDFEHPPKFDIYSQPVLKEEAQYLISKLQKLSKNKIGSLMQLSEQLADLNYARYQNWNFGSDENAKQAIFAFKGEVYRGFDVQELNRSDIEYAQTHLKILSGLYGVLRPMDLIQPYRLEMGTKWEVTKAKTDLYKYWGDKVTLALNNSLKASKSNILVNLASKEYFKAVHAKSISGEIVNITFKENKEGSFKVIGTFSKLARGRFARFITQNRVEDKESLKLFADDGYAYHDSLSSKNEFVFTR